ncbi:MAG TPA: hypothetical protein VIH21_06800 [Dehalococcoidia bacterium]
MGVVLSAFSLVGALLGVAAFGYIQQDLSLRQRQVAESQIRLGMIVFLISLIGATVAYSFLI